MDRWILESGTRDLGPGVRDPGSGARGPRTRSPGPGVPGPRCRNLNPRLLVFKNKRIWTKFKTWIGRIWQISTRGSILFKENRQVDSEIRDLGFGTRGPGPGVRDPESRVRVPVSGTRIPGPRCRNLNPRLLVFKTKRIWTKFKTWIGRIWQISTRGLILFIENRQVDSEIRDLGFGTRGPGPGVRDPESGSRIPGPGSPGPGSRDPDAGI